MTCLVQGGCIIRAGFLDDIKQAYERNLDLHNLLVDPYFGEKVAERQEAWREVIKMAITAGVAVPGLSISLAYFDAYRWADTSSCSTLLLASTNISLRMLPFINLVWSCCHTRMSSVHTGRPFASRPSIDLVSIFLWAPLLAVKALRRSVSMWPALLKQQLHVDP